MPLLRTLFVRAGGCAPLRSFQTLCLAAFLLLAAATPAALAQAAGTTPRGEDTPLNLPDGSLDEASDGGGGLVRTIVGLLVVIAVIYGVTWVLKQVRRSQTEDVLGGGLSDVARMSLGTGRSLHVVRAGDEYLLLGVADGGVSVLRTYSAEEAEEAGLLPADDDDDFRELGGSEPRRQGPMTLGALGTQLVDRLRKVTVRR